MHVFIHVYAKRFRRKLVCNFAEMFLAMFSGTFSEMYLDIYSGMFSGVIGNYSGMVLRTSRR